VNHRIRHDDLPCIARASDAVAWWMQANHRMKIHLAHEQGRRLGLALRELADERPFVLAIPRGGVIVADAVARALGAPLDVLLAGKIFAPGGRAIAAIAEGEALVFDDPVVAELHVDPHEVARLVDVERARQAGLLARVRGSWPMPALAGRTVVLVDDAVVTGLTMRAAIECVRARGARRIVVATPLCSTDSSAVLAAGANDVVHLESLPTPVAARVHGDERAKPCPPLGDAEIHDLIARELHDVGADPFGALAIDGV
jgi:predicted phosphoribosyltransferase